MLIVFERVEQFLRSDVFLAFAGLAVLMALVVWALNHTRPGPVKPVRFSDKPWLNTFFWVGVLLLPILVVLFAEVLWLLFKVVGAASDQIAEAETTEQRLDLRWTALAIVGLLTAMGGLLGTPLAFIRVHTTERQTVAQEQGLITDRINKAVENLGATRAMQGDATPPGEENRGSGKFQLHLPNLEVRIGAIYALERIAQDSLRDHVQIMEILTAYIRENAKAEDAEESPRARWLRAVEATGLAGEGLVEAAAMVDYETGMSEGWSLDAMPDWINNRPPLRTDIQAALTVIGRRNAAQQIKEEADTRQDQYGYRLDLRNTRLQKADISNLAFGKALLTGTRLEGADLSGARLEGADLSGARLESANLAGARLRQANLSEARLEGADLFGAGLEGADLFGAGLDRANLGRARLDRANLGLAGLDRANLHKARLEGANLHKARLEGAYLGGARLEGADLRGSSLAGADLVGARLTGADLGGARLERATLAGAQLEGTDFSHARLEWANLGEAVFDQFTEFWGAATPRAALKSVDLTKTRLSQEQLNSMFGDGSVILPSNAARPAHWPKHDLYWGYLLSSGFDDEWDLWKSDPDAYIPPQDRPD